MKHEIKDDIYYLYNSKNEIAMKIQLCADFLGDQIIITTPKEVFAGPVGFISFTDLEEKPNK